MAPCPASPVPDTYSLLWATGRLPAAIQTLLYFMDWLFFAGRENWEKRCQS
jgi:hypothetical protein